MIPLHAFAEIEPSENDEHAERHDFLDNFQLERRELAVSDTVCGHLKTILGEGHQPTHHDCREQRSLAVFQMTIPGDGHEYVRAQELQDSLDSTRIPSRVRMSGAEGTCRTEG